MGNICGKSSHDDNFSSPGRTLASAPPPPSNNARASVPSNAHQPPSQRSPLLGNGRTLGSGEGQTESPREAAAKAAEERIKAQNAKTGKIKKPSGRAALEEASYENRRAREADAMADARAYN
ncbi:hypothetical protein K490DRAFT_68768 [Saccharata proteae CBS 121410]|uniref:Uncharacterized protein n=1 Tax=Saccharata proteae CBS 121410 TaxID=1314787 RepID=A0A9P4HMQ0_9PEZI|nr:hypothetical protein K490DRAFT_68768 [Saccharata proteae CBS 121410]